MRHGNFGRKLSRKTEHRRALLRNLVTSLILEERIQTTLPKAKAARTVAERIITLGKRGDLHARRQAAEYCMTAASVKKLFEEIGKRFATRSGGYTRIIQTGWRKGDGADMAVLELVGTEVLQKRAEIRAKRAEARKKVGDQAAAAEQKAASAEELEKGEKKKE